MSAPDRSEWLHLESRESDVWSRISVLVARCNTQWHRELSAPVFLRVTLVNPEWVRLDGWKWGGWNPPDQGPAPTEADIPVGFV
jgi:hypothetical protein